ncbi:MAG: type II toxin-antitoxin system VapC family toxin [Desulfobacterales bacterium]|nr:type II toxin-antitoxin system VapC family toxin [Desulfobacterales bacterium]
MIVVDTHIVVWDALLPDRLSPKAKNALARANEGEGIILCDITLWEIAMLMAARRLKVESPYSEFIAHLLKSNTYHLHSITPAVAELSAHLFGDAHKDPADRIIAATAIIARCPLVTADAFLRRSDQMQTIW